MTANWYYRTKPIVPVEEYAGVVEFSGSWMKAALQYSYFVNLECVSEGDVMFNLALSEIKRKAKSEGIQIGDLLYFVNEKGVHHAAMITKIDSDGTLYYSAHTSDRINREITEDVLEAMKDDGDVALIVVKIRDDAK